MDKFLYIYIVLHLIALIFSINKKKTTFKDNASTVSSSNENKKYSMTKLDLIKKGLGIEPKKTQMKKEEEDPDKIEEDIKDDGCIIL